MPRKKSTLVCPKCDQTGGFLAKRWVKRNVNIPSEDKITDLYTAWDYAARICLRIRESMILFPPVVADDNIESYDMFREFNLFDQAKISEFRSKFKHIESKNAMTKKSRLTTQKKRKMVNHIIFPEDAGRITNTSISYLFCAMECLVLRDISPFIPITENFQYVYGRSIVLFFGLMLTDERFAHLPTRYLKILMDCAENGYGGASALNALPTSYCRRCRKNNIFVIMSQSRSSPTDFICAKCGCTERESQRLSTKQLHNIESRMIPKIKELHLYAPVFEELKKIYIVGLRDPQIRSNFLRRFSEYEKLAEKDLLTRRDEFFIGHYDNSKKNRRSWCHLSSLDLCRTRINHPNYMKYEELISIYAQAKDTPTRHDKTSILKVIYGELVDLLKLMNWPDRFVFDKIKLDIIESSATKIHVKVQDR